MDVRMTALDFKSYGFALYTISKNNYYQDKSYIIDLYNNGIKLINTLHKYDILYENDKIHKWLNLFIKHFNPISNSLHIIDTNGYLNSNETEKLFIEIKRCTKLLEIVKTYLPKPSNIICKTIGLLGIGYIIGQFIQVGSFISALFE